MNNVYQTSTQVAKNILKIDILIINADIPNNIQNLIRSKLNQISQNISKLQTRNINKHLTYINNRELRPIDIVLRMNPHPEVAMIGWSPPLIGKKQFTLSPIALRSIVSADNNTIRYRKAYIGQRLRNTVSVLVGNIDDTIRRSIRLGLDVKIKLNPNYRKLYSTAEILNQLNLSSITEDIITEDEEYIELEYLSDWDNFIRKHDVSEIEKLQIMNMTFNSVLDLHEEGSDYVFNEQSINQTFVKIWNIEKKYFDLCRQADLNETMIISRLLPVMIILPRELMYMMVHQLELENIKTIYGYKSVDEAITKSNEFSNKKIAAVLCLENDKHRIKQIKATQRSAFITIDSMIDKDIWEKFKRLEFDITDEQEFNILTDNLQQSLEEINIELDPELQKYVPIQFSVFLKDNFTLICNAVRAIVKGKPFYELKDNISNLVKKEAVLRQEFKEKHDNLDLSKKTEFELLRPTVDKLKIGMVRLKLLKEEIDTLYNQSEKTEIDNQSDLPEIERMKHKISSIAEKQFILAQSIGNFIVSTLRQNKSIFYNLKSTKFSIIEKDRRVFNFNSEEWELFGGREIIFLTRNINIAKLIVTLFRAESVPTKSFIKLRLPSGKPFKADLVFYDRSVRSSELNDIQSTGTSFYDSGNVNELLAKTEIQKKETLQQIKKHEASYIEQKNRYKDRDELIFKLSTEHDKLFEKIKSISKNYGESLQKYRLINQLYISYSIFYKEVFRKLDSIQRIIKRLEVIASQKEEGNVNNSRITMRASKQIVELTELITSFYYSLAFLRFTTRVLNTLPKITEKIVNKVAINEIKINKLKYRFPERSIKSCLFISSNDFASERILENILSMAMLQFRITRDRFKVVDPSKYLNYINKSIGFVAIALNGDGDQLERLANIIYDIVAVCPDVAIFALCKYPSMILNDHELLRDQKLINNLQYIKDRAYLTDLSIIQPDNRLHITSLYLYSMS